MELIDSMPPVLRRAAAAALLVLVGIALLRPESGSLTAVLCGAPLGSITLL